MNCISVSTAKELHNAKNNNYEKIILEGEFANKFKKAKKIADLSKWAIGILIATLGLATVSAPVTGGISYFAAAPVAAMTGAEISTIILASSIGITLIIAVCKNYNIYYEEGKVILTRK